MIRINDDGSSRLPWSNIFKHSEGFEAIENGSTVSDNIVEL